MTLRTRKTLKWCLWLLLLFLLGGMQSSPVFPELGGMRPDLLLAAGVSAIVLEPRAEAACGYAVLAGLVWDVLEGRLLGFYGMMLLLLGTVGVWLMENYLRVNPLCAALLSFAASVLCGLVCAEFYLFIWGYADGGTRLIFARIGWRAVYTAIAAPSVCILMRFIQERLLGKAGNLRKRAGVLTGDRKMDTDAENGKE